MMARLSKLGIAVLLAVAALGKLGLIASGRSEVAEAAWTLFLALIEASVAFLLILKRHERSCLFATLAIATGGVAQAAWSGRPCQCFGVFWDMSWRAHLGISSILGITSLLLVSAKPIDAPLMRQGDR
jgi:hypothetical protein